MRHCLNVSSTPNGGPPSSANTLLHLSDTDPVLAVSAIVPEEEERLSQILCDYVLVLGPTALILWANALAAGALLLG